MRFGRTNSGAPRFTALLIVICAAVLALASACGGDGDDEGSAASTTTETTESSGDLVAESKQVMEDGKESLLYYAGPEPDAEPGDMEVLAGGDWRGPSETPEPEASKKLHVISCLAGSGCETVGRAAVEAAEALGWDVKFVQAQGTPESYNTILASAIAEKPDGIITTAIPASQVADKIAEAREAGIKLVATAAIPEGGADEYDSYLQIMEALTSQMQAWWAIADSEGTAKVVLLWDYGFPHLVQGGDAAIEELERCSGCEILEVRKRTVSEAADPVAMQKIVNSLIQKYGDDLEYIMTPYGFGVAPVIEAVRAAGRTDIKVLSKNAEVQNLGAVAKGEQAADFGAPIDWTGWAAVDNMIRLFAGEEPLETHEHGIAVHVFEPDNAPADGIVDWTPFVDFKSEYKELWGIQ